MLIDHVDFASRSELNLFIIQVINNKQKQQFRNSSNKFIYLFISNSLNIKKNSLFSISGFIKPTEILRS